MIYELMKSRRSVRKFQAAAPSRELIERLVEAAITAPSASNKQPWRFLIVTRREVVSQLARAVGEAVERIAAHVPPDSVPALRAYGDYFTRFESAPVVIVPIFRGAPLLSNLVESQLPERDRELIAAMERDSALVGASLALLLVLRA